MADYDKVIPAGQTGKIIVTVDTKRFRGKLDKTITVVSNDPDNKRLTLHLYCSIVGVKILPATHAYFNVHLGESQTKELTVATIGEGPVTVHAIASKPNILVRLEKLNEKKPANVSDYWKQYKILITIPENFPEGRFAESVTLATSCQYDKIIKIPVAGSVIPTVTVSPGTILLNVTNNFQRTIKITKKFGTGLRILQVISDPPQLKADLIEKKKGKQYTINVTWSDTKSKGSFNGQIKIRTNDKQKPFISVPVHVTIK
ncbi:MAG: hypothetical protein GWP06_15095 [Actinobacteria bacterium]|nr:hypothetical protein [Actinomycetota bacterium]